MKCFAFFKVTARTHVRVCQCVCVNARARVRVHTACVCVYVRERERERVSACMCVRAGRLGYSGGVVLDFLDFPVNRHSPEPA